MSDPAYTFVHIQKTGGTSLRAALGLPNAPADKHRTALELRDAMGADAWAQRFSFAFVRNPWDRVVSWWEMVQRIPPERRTNAFLSYAGQARSFEEFVTTYSGVVTDGDGVKSVLRDQTSYLADETGARIVSHVGRYETLATDFVRIASMIGVQPSPLQRLNASPMRRHYARYYNAETREIVARAYARDIAAFGYAFEPAREPGV